MAVSLNVDCNHSISASFDPLDHWPRLATWSFAIAPRVPRVVFLFRRLRIHGTWRSAGGGMASLVYIGIECVVGVALEHHC